MARILCVWELGSGLGHLSHLRVVVEEATRLGHQVFLAARELGSVSQVMGELRPVLLQAPFKQDVVVADQSAFRCYAHLIEQQCFAHGSELSAYVRAWRSLFELVQPDLVVYEHSPTALVASAGLGFKKVLAGTGFSIPPLPQGPTEPLAPFPTTPSTEKVRAELLADEARLLGIINTVLASHGQPPWSSLACLYDQCEASFLFSPRQLDHFGERAADYLEPEPLPGRRTPVWAEGSGPRVYAYLRPIPSLEHLLRDLRTAGMNILLYMPKLAASVRNRWEGDGLRFVDQPVNLVAVADEADWVISNGNHSTTATFMRLGLPQLIIPLHQEQLFVALRLAAQGAGLVAYQDQGSFAQEISALAARPEFGQRARALKQRCELHPAQPAAPHIHQVLVRLIA